MTLRIGYLQEEVGDGAFEAAPRDLLAFGCHAVRVEGSSAADRFAKPVLEAVCGFLEGGDELLVPSLSHLGATTGTILATVDRLHGRGAALRLLEPEVCTAEPAGQALVQALRQLAPAAPVGGPQPRRSPIDRGAVQALRARGFGPSQIARKLGVSRMTVWRKLAAEQGA